jgi:thiol-disulfide isomerase/thioredoxin
MMLRNIPILALALCLSAAAVAQQEKLAVGDNAPGLDIERWVKGEETTIKPGQVYVIEFWATWCGPCRAVIPHLTELQKNYGDDGLTIIGVSIDEKTEAVAPFVRGQGDKMGYTVALDRHGGTKRAWMDAAGLQGIPASFIVDRKGKIAFIGHPNSDDFSATLRQVMAGRFDPKLQKQADPMLQAARRAKTQRNWLLASRHYDEIVALDAAVFVNVALEKFDMLLVDMDQREAAYDYARALMRTAYASDAGALQMLAEKVARDPKIDQAKRDLDLALQAAETSRRIAGRNDPKALATVALVHFHRGEMEQAIELQKQAYFSASPRVKPGYQRTLRTYQESAQRASASTRRP